MIIFQKITISAIKELQRVLEFSGLEESVDKSCDPSTEMPFLSITAAVLLLLLTSASSFLGVLFNTVDMT